MSTMDSPSSAGQLFGRVAVTSAYVIGAVLVGTLAMIFIWVAFKVSDFAGLDYWGGIAFLVVVAVLGVVLLRRPPRPWTPDVGRDIEIPQPPDGDGHEDNDDGGDRREPPPWEGLPEDDPLALKLRFNDAINNDRLDDAERILGQVRALGGEDTWCANAATTLANKRRRS